MKKIFKLLAIFAVGAFATTSCTKPGCTDSNSTNYSAEATEDDGSCLYRGDITFWCLPAVSEGLIDIGHDTLRFELEGEILDSIATESFFSPEGDCNLAGVVTIPRDELTYKERWYKYRVYGQLGVELYSDFILLEANECEAVKLE